jgi:hypothetical protein
VLNLPPTLTIVLPILVPPLPQRIQRHEAPPPGPPGPSLPTTIPFPIFVDMAIADRQSRVDGSSSSLSDLQ